MKNYKTIYLFLLFGYFSFAQIPCNTITISNLNFNFTNTTLPVVDEVYHADGSGANGKISTTGNVNVTNNVFYANTSISLKNGFKATASGSNRFLATLLPCLPTAPIKEEAKDISFASNSVILYPNPAATILNIETTNFSLQKIEIYGLDGKLVYSKIIDKETTNHSINVEQFSAGAYSIVFLSIEGETKKEKFIKI